MLRLLQVRSSQGDGSPEWTEHEDDRALVGR